MRRLPLLIALLGLVAASCSSAATFPNDAFAVAASSDIAVGSNRLLVGVAQAEGTRLGSPDERVSLRIAPSDAPDETTTYPAEFVWIVPDASGLYAAIVDIDRPGVWSVEVIPESGGTVETAAFQAAAESATPRVGTAAIAVQTPTTDDHAIEEITTDPAPEPALYTTSLDAAVVSGTPTVVAFATPAFCQTAACGPMLETVKDAVVDHPDVHFIHVEAYEGFTDPGFVPDGAHLAPAVIEWQLPSEPWVFVVDGDGVITHKFEGALGADELAAALG